MTRLLVGLLVLLAHAPAFAHPGHDPIAVSGTELAAGTPVVVAFTHAELKDGSDGLMALEVRGREVKKKKS